jgi:hypothetical protein
MVLLAQPGGGPTVTATMSLFGTPGEVDPTCGGNVCIGQGIEWGLSNPAAFPKLKIVFFEDPSLVQGLDIQQATAYKDGVAVEACGPTPIHRQDLPCVYKRVVLNGGRWKIVLLVTGEDPKGRI